MLKTNAVALLPRDWIVKSSSMRTEESN